MLLLTQALTQENQAPLIPYTGPELRPHYLLEKHQLEGSALLCFRGPCDVKTDHLVDWEDRLVNDSIRAEQMVHVLGEFFGISLREGVWAQRILMSIALELLQSMVHPSLASQIHRRGDDLFWKKDSVDYKLSVSIVTASPVSVLLHAAINVDAAGAPVKAAGLQDLGILDIGRFQELWMARFEQEWNSVFRACTKVRPVL